MKKIIISLTLINMLVMFVVIFCVSSYYKNQSKVAVSAILQEDINFMVMNIQNKVGGDK